MTGNLEYLFYWSKAIHYANGALCTQRAIQAFSAHLTTMEIKQSAAFRILSLDSSTPVIYFQHCFNSYS